jgi:hypothetical protein
VCIEDEEGNGIAFFYFESYANINDSFVVLPKQAVQIRPVARQRGFVCV